MPPIRELSRATFTPTPHPTPEAHRPVAATQEAPSAFARLVRGLSGEADRGEASVRRVLDAGRRGVPLDPTSLLALQAGIYRYGETMDLAARLVDKASSGVKTVVQGQ